ncbi:hypothetical protein V8C86DRAFT_2630693 [Haematococcus lacustris]
MPYDPLKHGAVLMQHNYQEGEEEEEEEEEARSSNGSRSRKANGMENTPSASDMDEAPGVVQGQNAKVNTDYRRGKRFKKLARILGSTAVQQSMQRFLKHTLGVVACLLLAHIGMFVLMFIQLNAQEHGVTDLNNLGLALRAAGEVGLVTRQLEQLYVPIPVTSPVELKGLTNASDIPPLREWYLENIRLFEAKHYQFFLGDRQSGRPLPSAFGIQQLWEEPSLVQQVYSAIPYNESIDFSNYIVITQSKDSLWNIGKLLLVAAMQVYQNAATVVKETGNLIQFKYFMYFMNNMPNVFADNYFLTMDKMVSYVLQGAARVNQIQTQLLALEGCVLCFLALAYMWFLASLVARQRFSIYSVFLGVPTGLVKALATMRMDLDDEDEDDEVEGELNTAEAAANAAANKESAAVHSTYEPPQQSYAALSFKGATFPSASGPPQGGSLGLAAGPPSPGGGGLATVLSNCWRQLAVWRRPVEASMKGQGSRQGAPRKHLRQSNLQSMLLVWPFFLWGMVIVACYAIGVSKLAAISGPIATFNMVNFVSVRTELFFFELQELVIEFNQTNMNLIRARVGERLHLLEKDYMAMMYGGAALPLETSPHFTLATNGLTYAGGLASEILFTTKACLCEDPKHCKEDPTIHHRPSQTACCWLSLQFINNARDVTKMNGLDPWLFGPEFAWFWYVRYDLLGGLAKLNVYYHSFVETVYKGVLDIHLAALVLTCAILICYLLFVLRPFVVKTRNETKRITELLSQLPPEVDAEGMLIKATSLVGKVASNQVVDDSQARVRQNTKTE